jgi:hypothetical protein
MSTFRTHLTALAAVAVAGAAATGVATAATGDAQITVGPQVALHAGQTAPFDAPGVRAVRRGKAIPAGYTLVGRRVTIDRGTAGSTGAAFAIACPAGTTARTLGSTGQNGPGLIGGTAYPGHKVVRLAVWSPPSLPRSTGMSYVVCR